MSRLLAGLALAAGTFATSIAPAAAQTTLKFAHLFPLTHYLWSEGGKVFDDAVSEATRGTIKFEVYPAAQLGKDYVTLLKSGLADVAIVVPSYRPDKLPLTGVAELRGFYGTNCEGTTKLWNVAKTGTGAEAQRWQEKVANVALDWAHEADAAGRPGTALPNAFRDASGSGF